MEPTTPRAIRDNAPESGRAAGCVFAGQPDGLGEPDLSRLNPLSGKVDGILIGEGFTASWYIQRLAARLPVVVIAGTLGAQAADVVAADNFSGAAAALITHRIADHGRRRLFHVGGPPNSPDAIQRRLALDHVLRGNPQCQLIGSVQGIFSIASGELAAEELLVWHRAALPDAVVCANDQMAIGVLRILTAADVRVPGEVAVTGFDDLYPAPPGRSAAHHGPPADARARRASLCPAARPHRPPDSWPRRAAAADRTRAAVKLRVPSRHRNPPGPQARFSGAVEILQAAIHDQRRVPAQCPICQVLPALSAGRRVVTITRDVGQNLLDDAGSSADWRS